MYGLLCSLTLGRNNNRHLEIDRLNLAEPLAEEKADDDDCSRDLNYNKHIHSTCAIQYDRSVSNSNIIYPSPKSNPALHRFPP
jgi:hypothetical protein